MIIYDTAIIAPRTKLYLNENVQIGDYTFISCKELHMDEKACIGRFCELQGRGSIYLGQGAQVCSHTQIITSTDTPAGLMSDLEDEERRCIRTGDITIGKDAYIGGHCTIMPGVTIGEGAVIGRGIYIDDDIEPWIMVTPKKELYYKKRRISDWCVKPLSGVGFKRYARNNDMEERDDGRKD